MVFAVQELELHSRTAALVAGNQIAKLTKDVTTNLKFQFFFNNVTKLGQS